MRQQIVNLSNVVISYGVIILAFLTPLFFLPTTSEFYEFNKQTLLVGGAVFLLLIWAIKMVAQRRFLITRTPLDLPLIIFALIYVLATIFSTDWFVSLAGFYPRFWGSTVSILSLIILYFTAVSNLRSRTLVTNALLALVIGTVVAALLNILHFFGLYVFSETWAQNRSWTPLASVNNLAFLISLVIPLTIGLLIYFKETTIRAFLTACLIILFGSFVAINLLGAWIALFFGALASLLFWNKISLDNEAKTSLIVTGVFWIFAVFLFMTSWGQSTLKSYINRSEVKEGKEKIELNKEISLPAGAGWNITTSALGERPILGSGPATYFYNFTAYKPFGLNNTAFWDLRFDRSSSEIFTLASSVGVLGLLSFLLIFFAVVRASYRYLTTAVESSLEVFIFASAAAFMAGSFFLNSSHTVSFAFFIILATAFSQLRGRLEGVDDVDIQVLALELGAIRAVPTPSSTVPNVASVKSGSNLLPFGFLLVTVFVALASGFYLSRSYLAEIHYQKSLLATVANRAKEVRDEQVAAITANPYRDTYHRSLALTDINIATSLSRRENLSDEDKNTLQGLVTESLNQGKIASGYQNPVLAGTSTRNVQNWEVVARIYEILAASVQNAQVHAAATYLRATQLDKANTRLYEALGRINLVNGNLDAAIRAFEDATIVKGDNVSAHFNLARVLKQKGGSEERVVRELQITLNLLPSDSKDRETVESELETAKAEFEKTKPTESTPSASPSR